MPEVSMSRQTRFTDMSREGYLMWLEIMQGKSVAALIEREMDENPYE